MLKGLDVSKALVVLEDGNVNAEISARNIADVKTAKTNTINVFDVLKYNTVVATKAAVQIYISGTHRGNKVSGKRSCRENVRRNKSKER